VINENCTVKGTVYAERIDGEISNSAVIPTISYENNSKGGYFYFDRELQLYGRYRYNMMCILDLGVFITSVNNFNGSSWLEIEVYKNGISAYKERFEGMKTGDTLSNIVPIPIYPGEADIPIVIEFRQVIHGWLSYKINKKMLSIFKTNPSSINFKF
jgi:hypothetical protein